MSTEHPNDSELKSAEANLPPAGDRTSWQIIAESWYQRTWTRRLAYVGGVAIFLMILHLIPYPLYVTERCIVTPTDRFYVRAQVEGLIVETLVREGDWVEAGEPIARLDDRDISYAEKQAKAEVDRLATNLEKVKNGNRIEEIQRVQAQVATWKQEVSFAQIENNRQRSLSAQGVASQADKDEARRDLAVKRSALAEARAELVLVEAGSRIEEFAVAKAALRGAQAKLEFYSKQKEFLTLTSPVAGHMLTPRFHERLHERKRPAKCI